MKCKFCGQELKKSSKEEDLYLCYNCKKKFRIKAKSEKSQPEEKAAEERQQVKRRPADEEQVRPERTSYEGRKRSAQSGQSSQARRRPSEEGRKRSAQSGQSSQARRRPANEAKNRPVNEAKNRPVNEVKSRPVKAQATKKAKKGLPKVAVIAIILLVAAIVIGAIVGFVLAKKKANSSSETTAAEMASDASVTAGMSVETDEPGQAYTLGNYTIAITKVESCETPDGSAGIKVYFDWTNDSKSETSAQFAFDAEAYQQSQFLDATTTTDGGEDTDNWGATVEPEDSGTVWKIFKLEDESDIDITVYDLDKGDSFVLEYKYSKL